MERWHANSKFGTMEFTGTEEGVTALKFVSTPDNFTAPQTAFQHTVVKQTGAYFNQTSRSFSFPLTMEGTAFQVKIWKLLLEIPFGTTTTYLNLARKHGDVKAIRAVAHAIGKNPILIAIPCHRVLGSDGSLVGYSGGLENKVKLLEHEGYPVQKSLDL